MNESNCSVMNSTPDINPAIKDIFIAGVGPVDAKIYTKLKNEGPKMCQTIKENCLQSEKSDICLLGKAIYITP
jgi:hypothetical protein